MRNELDGSNVGGDLWKSGCVLNEIKADNEKFLSKLQNLWGTSNSNNDEEVKIARYFFVLNDVIDQQEELEVDGGGGGDIITSPVAQAEILNDIKGLKISWRYCRGGSIILTQPSVSFLFMTFTNMFVMCFCGDISKNIPPYRILRSKDVKHLKVGKQKISNMKYLVKQLIRAAEIVNSHGLDLQKWSPRKVMDLYMGVTSDLSHVPGLYL